MQTENRNSFFIGVPGDYASCKVFAHSGICRGFSASLWAIPGNPLPGTDLSAR